MALSPMALSPMAFQFLLTDLHRILRDPPCVELQQFKVLNLFSFPAANRLCLISRITDGKPSDDHIRLFCRWRGSLSRLHNRRNSGRYLNTPLLTINCVAINSPDKLTELLFSSPVGHLNPAVTVSLCSLGKASCKRAPLYILAQLLGAFLASSIVYAQYNPYFKNIHGEPAKYTGSSLFRPR